MDSLLIHDSIYDRVADSRSAVDPRGAHDKHSLVWEGTIVQDSYQVDHEKRSSGQVEHQNHCHHHLHSLKLRNTCL